MALHCFTKHMSTAVPENLLAWNGERKMTRERERERERESQILKKESRFKDMDGPFRLNMSVTSGGSDEKVK